MFRTLLLTAAVALPLAVSAQGGAIQDDIQACGAAATEAGLLPEDGVSLRFVSDKGNRNRVLMLKAIYTDGTEPKTLECRMSRRAVKEVVEA